jgi:shikimate kinase
MSKEKLERIKSKYANCEDRFSASCTDILALQGQIEGFVKRESELIDKLKQKDKIIIEACVLMGGGTNWGISNFLNRKEIQEILKGGEL